MSKRLKHRIQEVCGLVNLSREDKLRRATEILNSTALKQEVCNEILGASHKDVEKAMKAIIAERQPSREEQEKLDLEESVPEKYDTSDIVKQPIYNRPKKTKKIFLREYTPEEVSKLLEASESSLESKTIESTSNNYPTYSQDEVQDLLRDYHNRPERKK